MEEVVAVEEEEEEVVVVKLKVMEILDYAPGLHIPVVRVKVEMEQKPLELAMNLTMMG